MTPKASFWVKRAFRPAIRRGAGCRLGGGWFQKRGCAWGAVLVS